MSEQKGKIIIAVTVAIIAVLILTTVSYYFFPPQGTTSTSPITPPMMPGPTPYNSTDTFTGITHFTLMSCITNFAMAAVFDTNEPGPTAGVD